MAFRKPVEGVIDVNVGSGRGITVKTTVPIVQPPSIVQALILYAPNHDVLGIIIVPAIMVPVVETLFMDVVFSTAPVVFRKVTFVCPEMKSVP